MKEHYVELKLKNFVLISCNDVSQMLRKILLGTLWMSMLVQSKSLMFQPLDCADIYNDSSFTSGVYLIYPAGSNSGQYVYCDMETDGGKWTVSS